MVVWSREIIGKWWEEEEKRAGIRADIPLTVSKRGLEIEEDEDLSQVVATYHVDPELESPHVRVVLDPRAKRLPERAVRKTFRNELRDIKRLAKRRPYLKRVLRLKVGG